MSTDEEIARRLGIPVSQVTGIGLFEHAFPGVLACLPAEQRTRVGDGFGRMLMEGARNDDTSALDAYRTGTQASRYDAAVLGVRSLLDAPEMRNVLSNCPRQPGTPQPSSQPSDGGFPWAWTVTGILAAGGLGWLLLRRRPPLAGHRPNPSDDSSPPRTMQDVKDRNVAFYRRQGRSDGFSYLGPESQVFRGGKSTEDSPKGGFYGPYVGPGGVFFVKPSLGGWPTIMQMRSTGEIKVIEHLLLENEAATARKLSEGGRITKEDEHHTRRDR